ncbi:LysR family transcriptional regulator ArgP [Halomonas halocynthiae]|uniref:LysR family transcriptional regulator ArgP n=1 Tax=Halomonas halocynthiae TaxID=176290 RepID=UPI0004259EB1|nr:LysR family transcriptional regulator ArgP [Halomonas halocynthiae]
MLNYKLLEALAAVIECDGFERAGDALGVSQSAVSQRIKALEIRLGQPVLVRTPALAPTPAGRRLLNHYQQVRLLERDLTTALPTLESGAPRLRIALNADSLATWWASAIAEFCTQQGVLLDLVIEDQAVGLKRLREGDVAACLCDSDQPIAGARCINIGHMAYSPYATPAYAARYFHDGLNDQAFRHAPAIVYGPHDRLQHRFLERCGYQGPFPYHLCPSSEGFVQLTLNSVGYGMMPCCQVTQQLASGQLISLSEEPLSIPLYWHFWRHSGELINHLTKHLQQVTIA